MPVVVTRELGSSALEELDLRPVGPRDVLVRIDASGICHSDISVMNGDLRGRLPVALGHEGAGRIVEVGADVSDLSAGDRVVLSAIPSCGSCWFCARAEPNLCERAEAIRRPPFLDGAVPVAGASGLGTFSDALVVDERAVVKVQTDLPSALLSLIGCAVLTGAGSVLNIAKVDAGTSVLVIGAGGIGLAAVQAARAQGALPIAVLDPSEAARVAAVRCGATHAIGPGDETEAGLQELTAGRGFDVTIDCVGVAATLATAWPLTRRGGEIVLIGVAPPTEAVPMSIVDIVLSGRKLSGCIYGGSSVHRDIPRFVAMAEAGRLDFDAMVGRTISLAETPTVLAETSATPGRTVIVNG